MTVFSELNRKEIGIGIAVLLLLFVHSNPFDMYMLGMTAMTSLTLLVVALAAFGVFVWGEGGVHDEREIAHQALVGRIAYLSGTLALLITIVMQSLAHNLDNSLICVLAVMILAKLLGNAYVRTRY